MPSIALSNFSASIIKCQQLYTVSLDQRLRPITKEQKENFLHASLALIVAGWDSYLKNVIREFYDNISDPLNPKFTQVYQISKAHMQRSLERFNTPNAENSRTMLLTLTGYDPIADWVWLTRGYTAQQTREFLNEILRVRHSFAHGFPIPTLPWTTASAGGVRLTVAGVKRCESLISYLVTKTDAGLKLHQSIGFGLTVW